MIKLFSPIGYLFGYLMYLLYGAIHNYGITLILFTIFLKVLMIPLGIMQQKGIISNARMQPKMQALQKMYGNNKERYGVEIQKLYQEEHFNPLSSCLPLLIMFPLLFGMLDVIYYPIKHMLRFPSEIIEQATTIATNLGYTLNRYSAQASVLNIAKANPSAFSALGKDYVDAMVNFDFSMFGLPLAETPVFKRGDLTTGVYLGLLLIPVLSGVSSFLLSKLSSSASPSTGNDQASNMARSMTYMMPLLSVFISFSVPAGVGIYWAISNILSLVQQMVLNKVMNPAEEIEKAKKELEEQKFAERMARIEAKKKAKEEREANPEDPANTNVLAEARKRMAEKYGD